MHAPPPRFPAALPTHRPAPLRTALQALSGKPVPADLRAHLRSLASSASKLLERAGLHIAALEALLVAAACNGSGSGGSGPEVAAGSYGGSDARYSRLLAACLSYSLVEVQEELQLGAEPEDGADDAACVRDQAAGGGGGGAAGWQDEARKLLARLQVRAGPGGRRGGGGSAEGGGGGDCLSSRHLLAPHVFSACGLLQP